MLSMKAYRSVARNVFVYAFCNFKVVDLIQTKTLELQKPSV